MRLTLRTLLAYLDDLLKPADAKEIGKRLSESSQAAGMAERIRQVLRRRRIKAPAVDGEPDANTVAEYLDNVLPDADVEQHERSCLASDEALAESAACHQILTLVMGKPIDVSETLKEAAYELDVPVAEGENGTEAPPESTATVDSSGQANHEHAVPPPRPRVEQASEPIVESKAVEPEPAAETVREPVVPVGKASPSSNGDDLPGFLAHERESSTMRWIGTALLVVVGIGVFASIYRTDDSFRRDRGGAFIVVDDSQRPKPLPAAEPAVIATGEPEGIDVEMAADETAADSITTGVSPAPQGEDSAIAAATLPSEPKMAGNANPSDTTSGASIPSNQPEPQSSDAIAKVDPASSETKPPADPKTMTAEQAAPATTTSAPPGVELPPALDAFVWQQLGSGLALHVDSIIGGWTTLPPRSKLFADERVVIPDPFECTIRVDEGPLLFQFLANSDVSVVGPDPETRGGIDLKRGRVVLSHSGEADADAKPVRFQLRMNGLDTVLEVGPGATAAIEMQSEPPDRLDAGMLPENRALVTVIQGPIALLETGDLAAPADSTAPSGAPPEPTSEESTPAPPSPEPDGDKEEAGETDEPEAAEAVADPAEGPDDTPVVEQGDNGRRVIVFGESIETRPFEGAPEWAIDTEPSALTRRYAVMYRNLIPDEQPLVPELVAILEEPTFRMSELAASTLTLLGEAPALVSALGSVHEETRRQAIDGLRRWLAEEPGRVDELRVLLATAYREQTVENLIDLLVGFTSEELRTFKLSDWLLTALEDPNMSVREVAFYDLKRMTGKTFDYQPNANAQSRGVSIRRWRDFLDRQGALLTPVIEETDEPIENE